MTAAALSAGYAARRFSPVEVTAALLRRTHRLNPLLNALYTVDEDRAMAAARASEARCAKGAAFGPLDGVPTTIKDALPSAGDPGYRGSAAHRDDPVAQWDAPAVARMREAGMVFLGKTTMPDFGILATGASSKHGVTRNPWRLDRTSGGSSAGAAASIAGGLAPVAVGTDIVGSIRLPASFTGLFGFKPSQGRVPYYPPNSPSLVAGPMARTVEDAALLMNIISRPDGRDYTALAPDHTDYTAILSRSVSGATIAVLTDLGFGVNPEPQVVSALEDAARLLEGAGLRLVRRQVAFSAADQRAAERFYKVRCRAEFLSMPEDGQARAATIAAWSGEADAMSATDFYHAFSRLEQMRERAAGLMDGCEFLILPTVPFVAFAAEQAGHGPDALFAAWINTFLFNLTGQAASSVPCTVSGEGLPIGLQIVGRRYDDAGVFALAGMFEALRPTHADITKIIARLDSDAEAALV